MKDPAPDSLFLGDDFSNIVLHHFPGDDITEQAFPVPGANGQEIRPGLRIIITL